MIWSFFVINSELISVFIGQVYSIFTLLQDFYVTTTLGCSPKGGVSPTEDPMMHSDVQALLIEVKKAPVWIHAHVAHRG